MFPESFPSIPNYLVNMLVGTDEFELTELFVARFMDVPLSGPAVARIIEAYIPMKSMCDQEAVRGPNYTKGPLVWAKPLKARDTGAMSYDFMCSSCRNVWAPKATKCFLCKKGEKIPYEAPGATLQVGKPGPCAQ